MINSVNNPTTAQRPASDLTPLVDRLAKRADINRPGQAGSAEFSGLLTDLVRSLDAEATDRGTTGPSDQTRNPTVSAPVAPPASRHDVLSVAARRAAASYDEAARIRER